MQRQFDHGRCFLHRAPLRGKPPGGRTRCRGADDGADAGGRPANSSLAETTFVLAAEKRRRTPRKFGFSHPRPSSRLPATRMSAPRSALATRGQHLWTPGRRFPDVRGNGRSRAAGAAEGKRVGRRCPAHRTSAALARATTCPPMPSPAACSIAVADIETAHHAPCVASCGTAFIFAELKVGHALQAARARFEVFSREFRSRSCHRESTFTSRATGSEGVDIRAQGCSPRCSEGPQRIRRPAAPNVALAGLLGRAYGPEPDLSLRLRIAQGAEMQGARASSTPPPRKRGGRVTETRIGGSCVAVMSGIINI